MLKVTNETPRIPTDRRKSRWLFTKPGAELSSGLSKTNTASGREEDVNPGPPDYQPNEIQISLINRSVMVTENSIREEKW